MYEVKLRERRGSCRDAAVEFLTSPLLLTSSLSHPVTSCDLFDRTESLKFSLLETLPNV